jgi:WD40 repeat protein
MSRTLLFGCGIVFLCLLHSARGAEADPDALPPGAVARLGWSPLRIGYTNFVLTPDGRTIVVVTPQGNLRRLDAQTGRLLERRQLTERRDVTLGDGTTTHPSALSANGESVAVYELSYEGPRVTVYEVASGKQIFRRASTETRSTELGALSPDGKQLAVIESENKKVRLRIFDIKTGRMRELGPFEHGILKIHFSADGKQFIVAAQNIAATDNVHFSGIPAPYIVTAFDLSSGKEIWRRTIWGMGFAISRDGKMVLTSGSPKEELGSALGSALVTESQVTGFRVLEIGAEANKATERFVPCPLGSHLLGITNFALAPDGHTLVIDHFDEKGASYIVLWDFRTRKEIRRFQLPKTKSRNLPFSLAISADGGTLLTNGEYLQRWDLTTGKPFFAPPPDDSLSGALLQLAFTPDSQELFASSIGGLSSRWNVATRKRIDLIHHHYGGHRFLRTPEGLRTIVEWPRPGNWSELIISDPITHKTLRTIRNTRPNEGFGYPALTASGKTLLAINPGKNTSIVTTWDVKTGRQASHFTLPGNSAFPQAPFSPCGRWMVLNGKLYQTTTGVELFAPAGRPGERMICGDKPGHGLVWFSEDGRLMAAHLHHKDAKSAAEDTLAVWELASGQILARFDKAGFVAQAAFAPDGRTIALLDAQGVRMEDLVSGKQLARYPAPDVIYGSDSTDYQGIVFAPDGSTLATGHQDGSIVLWKVPLSHQGRSAALTDGEIDKLWTDLGSSSPATARAALDRLVRHPDAATSLLAMRFRPPPVDDKLDALIKDLDSDFFATREETSRKILAYGARAEAALRRTLTQAPSLEMRRRIEGILADMKPLPLRLPLSGERLRGVRAIEVLERINNTAARKLLQSWAGQTENGQLAIEAQLALERLAGRG